MHRANSDFWQHYRELPQDIRDRADKQFALLTANPQHPSLQFKKLRAPRAGSLVGTRDAELPGAGDQAARRLSLVLDWRP